MDDNLPVLVGVSAITGRDADHDVLDLMTAAARGALGDASGTVARGNIGTVLVPRGTWTHADAGREVANRIGATAARSIAAEVGVLQQTLISRACAAVTRGGASFALVLGGEAAASDRRRGQRATPVPSSHDPGVAPDEVLTPADGIVGGLEVHRRLWTPSTQYAMIESTLGRATASLHESWASFSRVASRNPDAWDRSGVTHEDLAWATSSNRPVAFPYGRRHCSQMYVDQASALLFCSVATARSARIPTDRWVFPHALAESNHVIPLPARIDPGRSPGFAAVGVALAEGIGRGLPEIEHVDLYSCFPAAVEVQRREFGLAADRMTTVTGGMSFGGGPFNSYSLHSTVKMVQVLRAHPGEHGLVTAISGMITKQAGAVWSTTPPIRFKSSDVSRIAARQPIAPIIEVPDADNVCSPARVVASTVTVDRSESVLAVVLAELADGRRTLVATDNPAVTAAMTQGTSSPTIVVRGTDFTPT